MDGLPLEARQYFLKQNMKIILTPMAKWKKSVFSSDDGVIVIADRKFGFFTKGKTNAPSIYESWLKLRRLTQKKENIFKLDFGEKKIYKFECKDYKGAFGAIGDVLQHILYEDEKMELGLDQFQFQKANYTTNSILSRFLEMLEFSRTPADQEDRQKIIDIIKFAQSTFDFTKFNDFDAISQAAFDIIPMCSFAKDIRIPSLTKSVLKSFYQLLESTNGIYNITINGPIDPKFRDLFRQLSRKEFPNLSSLSFNNSQLTKDDLDELLNTAKTLALRHFGINNSLTNEIETAVYDEFLQKEETQTIVSLGLNNINGVRYERLINNGNRLLALSLENCNLDISTTITDLSKANLPYLQLLNLSGNRCENNFPKKITFPPKLHVLSIDNVKFSRKALTAGLRTIFSQLPDGFTLNISDFSVPDSELEAAFNLLETQDGRRVGCFRWNNNPVDERFFTFISHCPNVSILSLNGCLDQSDSESINNFAKSIKNLKHLSYLRIAGSSNKNISSKLSAALKYIHKLESIMFLDISNNNLGDSGVTQLADILSPIRSLKNVVFDSNNVKDANTLLKFVEKLSNAHFGGRISFPSNDFENLCIEGKFEQENLGEVITKYREYDGGLNTLMTRQPPVGDAKALYPKPAKNPLDDPASIYRAELSEGFPTYFPDSFVNELLSRPEPIRSPYGKPLKGIPSHDSRKNTRNDSDDNSDDSENSDNSDYSNHDDNSDETDSESLTDSGEGGKHKRKNKAKQKPNKKSISKKKSRGHYSSDEDFIPRRKGKLGLKSEWGTPAEIFDSSQSSEDDFAESHHKKAPKLPSTHAKPASRGGRLKARQRGIEFDDSSSDSFAEEPPQYRRPGKVRQATAPVLGSAMSSGSDRDSDEEEENFEPRDPDWTFPLRMVPRPPDTEAVVRDLGEKYSLGALLTAVKRST